MVSSSLLQMREKLDEECLGVLRDYRVGRSTVPASSEDDGAIIVDCTGLSTINMFILINK